MANRGVCPACGCMNRDDSPFCAQCGEPLWREERARTTSAVSRTASAAAETALPHLAWQLAFWLGTAGMLIAWLYKKAIASEVPLAGMMVKAWILGGLLRIPVLHIIAAAAGCVKF